jgi:hypothetical protein
MMMLGRSLSLSSLENTEEDLRLGLVVLNLRFLLEEITDWEAFDACTGLNL